MKTEATAEARHDLFGVDFAHFPLSKVGHQLLVEDMLFRSPGVRLDTAFHVCGVERHEALKGHIQVGGLLLQERPFPLQRLPLGLEAPLLGLLALAVPVGIAVTARQVFVFSSL